MRSSRWPEAVGVGKPAGIGRRRLVAAALAAPAFRLRAAAPDAEALLRGGGVVIAFRHALAPGTFDPPGFTLGDCSTQRNLSDDGRAQARRMGEWFAQRKLQPQRVRSSPWCRCIDTAELAFGRAERWAALGSPRGASETTNEQSLRELREAVVAAGRARNGFDVWVTHMFVLSALVGENTGSGEGLVLRAEGGTVKAIARLAPA